ncbi:O-acetyl-ADP-ribose deacetylase [Planococcus lenghuensis]|uniref:O-acetyl-ADP-ribose deacetylase n=1 Tax=Planococcus lenghuensis TaxID=2213202 RepID=A0A1Q2L2C1_9BACL|nr:O-acetyl-ADP-ribose deacetylase [Planococcus lenghuensis]AQQ54571.1 O-acetyl-ADP-ribose deacetylase [Planococcus lenghuensis]
MQIEINGNALKLITGDITKQETEAIVNAANGTLLGGGGVDGAIHRAAGPELLAECRQIRQEQLNGEKLPTGKAVITKGYRLPASFVIHTVGPVWSGKEGKDKLLADCYRNSLQLAAAHGIHSISFPSISTGIYRFPIDRAATVALSTIVEFLDSREFGEVVMTLFSQSDYEVYEAALKKLMD